MLVKSVIRFAIFGLAMAALVFWPAQTFAYPGGWAFLAILIIGGIVISVWLYRHDPKLYRERMGSPAQRTQQGWDRVFMLFLMATFTVWIAFSAWDAARHGFNAAPIWVQVAGGVCVGLYLVGAWLTFRENSFAAPVVKMQEGQRVIDTGPYSVVRHPMYAGALFLFIGTPLLLGSWWGLILSAVLIAGVAWRAVKEEDMLRAELAGYSDYAKRVRYRFVPLVW